MDKKAHYEILRTNKTRIIRNYVNNYYGQIAWHVGVLAEIPPRQEPILDEIESRKNWGPSEKEILWALYLCSKKYLMGLSNITWVQMVDNLERFYINRFPKTFHELYHAKFKGYPTKLSATIATHELLSRGFIDKRDTKGFLKTKYSIVVHSSNLTWPSQFDSQQDGLLFLKKYGINGHCGCPALDYQKNFTNGL